MEKALERGVMSPISQPSHWVSTLCVAFQKNKKLRVCLDPAELNKALLREPCPMPIFEDPSQEMAGARLFSKVYLKAGFWQMPVDDKTSE